MKSNESAALCRILRDLVIADTVIDRKEMSCYRKLKEDFKLNRDDECDGYEMTWQEAIDILRDSSAELRNDILESCRSVCTSDGFCARQEALPMMALKCTLENNASDVYSCYSFLKQVHNIPDACVIYIESKDDNKSKIVKEEIKSNYRLLYSELKLAGFEFIYIPNVIEHYRDSSDDLVDDIVSFVAPQLSDDARAHSIDRLKSMTTLEFTRDILCNKLGMEMARNTAPALLFKIGTSFVGNNVYSNYFKINVESGVVKLVEGFIEGFSKMLSSDLVVINSMREQHDQFLYSGFYKLLLDTHLMLRNVRSAIQIDPYANNKQSIYLQDIDKYAVLGPREAALYTLLIYKCVKGEKISFKKPTTTGELKKYNSRITSFQTDYSSFYGKFSTNCNVPNMAESTHRSSAISNIRKALVGFKSMLYNIGDYMPTTDADGNVNIYLDPALIKIKKSLNGDFVPIQDYEL